MSFIRPALFKWAWSAAFAAAALSAAAAANAEVNVTFGVDGAVYYEPAPVYQAPPPPVYYQPAPPVYYQPAPPPVYYPQPQGYYAPQPGYYAPAPGYRERDEYRGQVRTEQPKLNDMQRRAMDNCSLLAPREQSRCRATVMSTVR